jgi:DNA-binding transcriptional regulator YbjK
MVFSFDYENQIAQKQAEIDMLKSEQGQFAQKPYKQQEETATIVAEPPTTYGSKKNNIKQIIERYLAYKEKGKKSLEDEAKTRGINVKGKKVDEIIMILMTTQDSKLNLE